MAFTCPRCGRTSHNPNDEREGYCGACRDWTGDQQPGTNRQWRSVVKNMTKSIAALEQENEGLRARIAELEAELAQEKRLNKLMLDADFEGLWQESEDEVEKLKAENERLRWALGKGLTESEAADYLAKEGD